MRTLSEMQADVAREKADKARLTAQMRDIHARAEGRELTPGEDEKFNNLRRGTEKIDERIEQLEADMRNQLHESFETRVEPGDGGVPLHGGFNSRRSIGGKPWEPRNWDDADEVRGRVVDSLAVRGADDASLARMEKVAEGNEADARAFLAASSPAYERAFLKMLANPTLGHNRWTSEERAAMERAMVVGTNSQGGYMVPTHLDPTIILTNAGSTNAVRQLARVVTLNEGNVWHGVSSAGVTASWDAELAEVSDDTPVIAPITIPVYMARCFVPYSLESEDDIASLGADLGMLFADSKDRLEGAAFTTGAGTTEPKGVFTAVSAVTASRVVSTTAATIGLVDLHATYKAVPGRSRVNASWLGNPLYTLAVKALGTAVSASYSGDLRDPSAGRILGRPVFESDDAPSTQTTTALDSELLIGDFSQYVIVDRVGLKVEVVPHLMGATYRPIGARGLFARWRVGGDVSNVDAFRLLADKTTA